MNEVTSITVAQLRAAFLAWETDVRADRAAFGSEEFERTRPLDEAADASVAVVLGYVEKARQPGAPPA